MRYRERLYNSKSKARLSARRTIRRSRGPYSPKRYRLHRVGSRYGVTYSS